MWLWALLPVCLALFGTVGIWAVFAIAVTNGSINLNEGFPFISACGTYPPQSSLFSQVCNICSALGLWIVAIRFQQVKDFGDHGKANVASIVLGFISSVGTSVLGNFQPTVVESVHLLGTFLAFFLGLAYFWVQLYLTYRARPARDRYYAGPARATGCIICTVMIILMAVFHFTHNRSAAAICEWILVMAFLCLFGLFAVEFRHIDCHQLTVQKRALESDQRPSTIEVNSYVTNTLT